MLSGAMSNPAWKQEYEAYLRTAGWRVKRRKVLARDLYKCQKCGSDDGLQIHHLTYDHLFNEPLEDLVTWCRGCHRKHHKPFGKRPRRVGSRAKGTNPRARGKSPRQLGTNPKRKRKGPKPLPAKPVRVNKKLIHENDELHARQVASRERRARTRPAD